MFASNVISNDNTGEWPILKCTEQFYFIICFTNRNQPIHKINKYYEPSTRSRNVIFILLY